MAMQRSLSFDNQWQQTVNDINQLVHVHVNEPREVDRYKGRSHWGAALDGKKCANQICQTHFGLFERPRNCHRCGGLFCKQCTSYERRFNSNGNFDPAGRLCQVCETCFGVSRQSLGFTASHLSLFLQLRSWCRTARHNSMTRNDKTPSLNFEKECQRLCDGFTASLQNLRIGQTISDMFGMTNLEWEKSPSLLYGKMAERCYRCQLQFGFLQRRHNCVICGAAVCEKCSSRDLIVYIPDEDVVMETDPSTAAAKLAIIRILGCPEEEPHCCRYLRVCEPCNKHVQSRQIAEYQTARCQSVVDEVSRTWVLLDQLNEKLRKLQMKIDENLPHFCELLDLLDVGTRHSPASLKHKNAMQILSKSQVDLSDHFAKFVTTISGVKQLKPSTNGQMKILRNIIMSKVEYYHENMAEFRSLQRQLESVVPPKSLIVIQNCVDKNAINSCYISVKQLIFEVIHICQKHHLEDTPATKLIPLEEATRRDLQSYVEGSWEEHVQTVEDLLRYQLAKHRLICVSSEADKNVMMALIVRRIRTILEKVLFQLVTKASDGKFQATKSLLMELSDSSKVS